MSLPPGTRLGPYEIVAPLGSGGMGEVHRAKDTRLGREVAIKVLPQHLSANPEVRARFEREAKTISSLNHPHICTLFDIGREGDTDYLVMELVEGETLAQRLAKGALPAAEVLRLGAQIADALDRAHRAGVVHRDLKPGNVMLTKSGAKLMDFGLARASLASGPVSGSGSVMATLTQSPTMVSPLTAEGSIVGTFQYMPPEQLEGREADARSDLWALGCVLYEMATGRRAFDGRSQASLISAIMSGEPAPVSLLAPASPAALDRLIGRCLAKDPDDRWQSARDLMHELRAMGESGSQSGVRTAVAIPRRTASRLPWAIAAVLGLVAAGLGFTVISRNLAPKLPVQLALVTSDVLRFGLHTSVIAISPDGRAVAYTAFDTSGTPGLWLQRLEAPQAVLLTRLEGSSQVFWSPDSRTIGFLDPGAGKLKSIPATGGAPVTLCAAANGRGGTWSPGGVIVLGPDAQGPLYRVPAGGGPLAQVTWLDSTRHEAAHRFPCFLPDGEHFLFASLPAGPEGHGIFVGSLRSREVRKILDANSAAVYAAPGYLLFQRGENLMAQRFDARSLKLAGDAVAIADAPPFSEVSAEPIVTASRDGRLVFLSGKLPDTQLEWLDRSGARRGVLSLAPGQWRRPALSPDDRFAVVENGDDLWRVDLARSVAARLTSNGASNTEAIWSPDGSQIAFTMGNRGREQIMVLNSDGSGEARELATDHNLFKTADDWSSKGIVFNSIAAETFRDLWLVPATGGAPVSLVRTRAGDHRAKVSPDGRWLAYVSAEAGNDDVYIQSFPDPGHKIRVSSRGANRVWWMPGSDEVCYTTLAGELASVKLVRRGDDLEAGEPRLLFRLPQGARGGDFSHDGQRVLVASSVATTPRRSLRVVLDWTGLLRK
jgi:eukaryotic-like serine/threonine-protein kinase